MNLERAVANVEDGEKAEIRKEQIEKLFKGVTYYDGIEKNIAEDYEERFKGDYAAAGELLNKKLIERGVRLEERQERARTLRRAALLIGRHHEEETDLIEKLNEYIAREERV